MFFYIRHNNAIERTQISLEDELATLFPDKF